MARIRTIKPEFFLNEQVASVPFPDRLLFIGLWTQADRAGRLEDRPMRLKKVLFPYDDVDIDGALDRLAEANVLTRYEGQGRRLIQIHTFAKHQRPHHREPDTEFVGMDEPGQNRAKPLAWKPANGVSPLGREGKGMEGNGMEGKGTAPPTSSLHERFEAFWAVYPRPVGKGAAWTVWQKLRPSADMTAEILAAVHNQAQSSQWRKEGGAFVPHPRTWLSQGRWQDQPDNIGPGAKPSPPPVEDPAREQQQHRARLIRAASRLIEDGMSPEEARRQVGLE